jgi:hypothetical protein
MPRVSARTIFLSLLYAALSIVFCAPLLARPTGLGIFDWDQHLFYYAQVIKNVVEYAQPPFWSPWYCGGNVLWQNPQTPLLSPVFPMTPIFGLALAMKVNIILHYWAGFLGMHRLLTRIVGLSFLPLVVYLASVFVLDGAHAMHLGVGHSVFLPSFYLPWLLYFFVRSVQTGAVRPALSAGVILALTIYNGGLHIVPMAILAAGALSVGLAISLKAWRPIVLALLVGVIGAAYAAPKLLPVSLFVTSDRFWDSRDEGSGRDRMTPALIWRAFTDSTQNAGSRFLGAGRPHGWVEYGNYIGMFGTVLIAASIIWLFAHPSAPSARLGIPVAFTAVMFLLLTAGDFSGVAPATLLKHVPLFSSFRLPSRYTVVFALFGAMAAGIAAREVSERIVVSSTRRIAAAMICAIALLQLITVNRVHFQKSFSLLPLDTQFRVLGGTGTLDRETFVNPYRPNAPMLRALMNDQAVMWCYESLQLKRGADSERPLVWTNGPATISAIAFTPNRVQFRVIGGPEAGKVFMNQNYAEGWRSTAGPVQLDPQAGGRMYVELAPGQTGRFSFSFVPPGLWAGVVILAIAIVASIVLWDRRIGVA